MFGLFAQCATASSGCSVSSAASVGSLLAFGFAGEVAGTPCLAAAKGAATREVLRRSRLAPPQLFRVDPEKRKPAVQKDRRPAATGSNLHEGRPVEIEIPRHPVSLAGTALDEFCELAAVAPAADGVRRHPDHDFSARGDVVFI